MYKSIERLEEQLQAQGRSILKPDGTHDMDKFWALKCECGHRLSNHIFGGICLIVEAEYLPGIANPHVLGCFCEEFVLKNDNYRKIRR